jgi:hypothetical protein
VCDGVCERDNVADLSIDTEEEWVFEGGVLVKERKSDNVCVAVGEFETDKLKINDWDKV